jgi:drug/metabolite transporter (DMT)-like permease
MRTTVADSVRPVSSAPRVSYAALAVAVVGVSASAPIIAAAAAPVLAVAFWRNAVSAGLLLPVALVRDREQLRRLGRREWLMAGGAGVLLAAHFAAWMPSLRFTSIASSTALVCSQPLWAAVITRLRGEPVPHRTWLGLLLASVGVMVLTGIDVTLSGRALLGDLLALLGGVFGAGYVTLGAGVRKHVSTTAYTAVCYAAAAGTLLVLCLATGQELHGYSGDTWMKLGLLVLFGQLLGHSMMNLALRVTSPTFVSVVALLEVPGASLLAAAWLGQIPPVSALFAVALILGGVVVATERRNRSDETTRQHQAMKVTPRAMSEASRS